MDDPPLFTRLAHVYFAAASFSETARRLGRASLAPGFLLHSHPSYGPGLRACLAQVRAGAARHDRVALFEALARLITPFDIAGLLDPDRQGWYPVTAKDLVENRAKLGASLEDVQQLLQRVGMTMPTP
mgnify:FL=1